LTLFRLGGIFSSRFLKQDDDTYIGYTDVDIIINDYYMKFY